MKMENVQDIYPLSPMQQGILFECLAADPQAGLYVEQFAYSFDGSFDPDSFRSAWSQLTSRHTVLRTSFHWEGLDAPVQVVRKSVELDWQLLDWSDCETSQQEAKLGTLRDALRREGFRFEQAPLMRLRLIRLAADRHVFVWTHHHLLLDGWCVPILVRELVACYNAALKGETAILPPVRQYRDHLAWISQQDRQAARRYWEERLGDIDAPTLLSGSLPVVWGPEGKGPADLEIDAGLARSLGDFVRDHRLTLNTLFQGALAILLSRACRQDSIVFGATVSGRPADLPGVETMVGLFINTLPMRVDLTDQPLAEWLQGLMQQAQAQDAFAYSSLAEVQGAAKIETRALFDTILVFENFPVSDANLGASIAGAPRVRTLEIVENTNYPLAIAVLPGVERIGLRLYHGKGIASPVAHRLGEMLVAILQAMVAHPSATSLNLPLAPLPAPATLLPAQADCLHHRLRDITLRKPDAIALTPLAFHGGQSCKGISFGQLDARANGLAHRLLAEGCRSGTLVGLCLPPGPELIIAIIAILKAGGAYVPLDPTSPPDRIAMILQDAATPLLISYPDQMSGIDLGGCKLLMPDGTVSDDPPNVATTPDDPAYVIYTSGSTGKPKGVLVSHRNVDRLLTRTASQFHFGPADVWVLFHSAAFDFSVWEIFGCLLHGGRLVLPPALLCRSVPEFRQMLADQGVTVLNQTPSAFGQLVQHETTEGLPPLGLRWVIFGGEALDFAMLRPWFARHGDTRPVLVNMYGITETTVHVTYRRVTAADCDRPHSLVGVPIDDLQLLLLDAAGNAVLPGLPGELHVAGAGVAQGYLNRPTLTAERFVDHPVFGRLYKSGDIARQVLDHTGATIDLDYCGRGDDQVKIRGYRIETGEIAAALRLAPGVANCIVSTAEDSTSGARRLVAWIVPDARSAPGVLGRLPFDGATTDLPDGTRVAHLNLNETRFLYDEIFRDRSYLRHGITLCPGDVVFDVGANIGMAALFFAREAGFDLTVHAFEPIAPVYAILQQNFDLHGLRGQAHNLGLGGAPGQVQMRHFPRLTIVSGQDVAEAEARQSVASFAESQGGGQDDAIAWRMQSVEVPARIETLSSVIRAQGITRIDLLKIDVEKAEMAVFAGLEDEHWPLIRQIVVEVHDIEGRVQALAKDLAARGFTVVHEKAFGGGDAVALVNLYARRPEMDHRQATPPAPQMTPAVWAATVREFCSASLPAYMVPSDLVPVRRIPLTRNGKADLAALQLMALDRAPETVMSRPLTEVEQLLAEIWRAALGIASDRPIGPEDDFFLLGGHSLLATRVIARIRDVFALRLPVHALFEAPQLYQFAARIEADRRPGAAPEAAEFQIHPDPDQRFSPFPMTEIQEAYWLGRSSAFDLGNIATHGYIEVDCQSLDLPRFEAAWRALVSRHDMLRMVVLPESGQQRILPDDAPYTIQLIDAASGTDERLARIRQDMSHQILDATTGPLFDIRAATLPGDVTRIFFSIDALWADAHSLRILLGELFTLYARPETELPPIGLSFRDYVLAETTARAGEAYASSLAYWTDRLPAFPAAPALPLRRRGGSHKPPEFRRRAFTLPAAQWSALKGRAARLGLTPSGVLLAAFADVLAYWSDEPHFALNLTLFNRQPVHPDLNRVIGDFTSLILLEVDNRPIDRFLDRAKRLQGQLWRDLEHARVNGVRVLRELARQNSGGVPRAAMPIVFTSTLGLAAQSASGAPMGEVVYSITQTSQVWLDHKVSERQGALQVDWDALDDVFPDGLLDAMFAAYTEQLTSLAETDAAWKDMNAGRLPPPDQWALIGKANATETDFSQGLLHEGWLRVAHDAPDSQAILWQGGALSHGALRAQANRIAHALRDQGIRKAEPVVVLIEKSPDQIAAVLGILIAGGAYVPVDPDQPAERIGQILQRLSARLILTRDRFAAQAGNTRARLVIIDGDALASLPTHDPDPAPLAPTDLAYVIFTSGSTGVPKGVMIDHRGARNTVLDINARFDISARDRVLALSVLHFDLSVWDIFGVLGAGGALVLPDPSLRLEPGHWADLGRENRVTVWNTVPALMQMLTDHLSSGAAPPPDLRLVMLSGDWIPLTLPPRIRALWPAARQIAMGGATEASIWSNWHEIGTIDPDWTSVPYGLPLANQSYHIRNHHGAPVPILVPGELCIGGIGVAMGYFGDAAQTEASFVTDPRSGNRIYRTGDFGRYLPNGEIEFLGRRDAQVKIRGHRIELGDISAALNALPGISSAIVLAEGGDRLVAHVVGEPASAKADQANFKLGQPGLRPDRTALPAIGLDRPEIEPEHWLSRQSRRRFLSSPVPVKALGNLLAPLATIELEGGLTRRSYPSAGNLYPVQVYLVVKPGAVDGLEAGLYWYDPSGHQLRSLSPKLTVPGAVWGPDHGFNRRIADSAGFAILLISRPAAIHPVYGTNLAEKFALLEAGYLAQLLQETAPALELGLCALGGMDFDAVRPAFRLEDDQTLLHIVVGGRVAEAGAWPEEPEAAPPLDEQIRSAVRQKLPDYMVPDQVVLWPALPLSANGKIDRAALTAATRQLSRPSASYVPPRDLVEQNLAELWQLVLSLPGTPGVTENFFDLGGQSLLAVRLATEVERRFGLALSLDQIFRNGTIEMQATLLRDQNATGGKGTMLVPLRATGTETPLFCFPGSGGHGLYFHHLARALTGDRPVYVLQSPATDGHSAPFSRIEDMAEAYLPLIRQVQPEGPYLLIGHSLGGKVALQIAQDLIGLGQTVERLIAVDALPFYVGKDQLDSWDDLDLLAGLLRTGADYAGEAIDDERARLLPLSTAGRMAAVRDALVQAGLVPQDVGLDRLHQMVGLFSANTRAHLAYGPRPVRPVPVDLILADEHDAKTVATMLAAWQAVGPTRLTTLPGTHASLLAPARISEFVAKLESLLPLSLA